jgi:hypothetical protein
MVSPNPVLQRVEGIKSAVIDAETKGCIIKSALKGIPPTFTLYERTKLLLKRSELNHSVRPFGGVADQLLVTTETGVLVEFSMVIT